MCIVINMNFPRIRQIIGHWELLVPIGFVIGANVIVILFEPLNLIFTLPLSTLAIALVVSIGRRLDSA